MVWIEKWLGLVYESFICGPSVCMEKCLCIFRFRIQILVSYQMKTYMVKTDLKSINLKSENVKCAGD